MKETKFFLVCLTFSLAFTEVIKSKWRQENYFRYRYFIGCIGGSWHSVTLDDNYFDDVAITSQAPLRLNNASMRVL